MEFSYIHTLFVTHIHAAHAYIHKTYVHTVLTEDAGQLLTDRSTHTYIHTYIQTDSSTEAYIHACIHTYIHTYIQTNKHTQF